MIANLLTLTREKRAFSMKRHLMPVAALTTLKKVAFAFLCFTVLMGFGASAQTIQSIKVDPGNNNGPPAGPILDLGGTYATPSTTAVAIPNDGQETYAQFSVNFTANATNSTCTNGVCSTVITFAFRDDPAQISFTNASVTDVTNPSSPGPNLLTNGNFSTGVLTPWTYVDNYGVSGAGFVALAGQYQDNCPSLNGAVFNCWIDGAVQAYDAISQTITTNPGDTYEISFYVAENSGLIATRGDSQISPNYPGSACYLALVAGAAAGGPPAPCYFSDLSTNNDTTDPGGTGINVAAYAQPTVPVASQEETLTVTGAGAGSGTVADTTYNEFDCTITGGSAAATGCSANYPLNTVITLTATPAEGSTFGGWGVGACAGSGTSTTCSVTMSSAQSVQAIFNLPGSSVQAGPATPGTTLDLNYDGGGLNGATGYDANVLLYTGSTQTVQVNAIPQSQTDCNQLVQLTSAFQNAQCFVYSNPTTLASYGAVMFEYTCPGSSTGGTCGSSSMADFVALLGTDFSFDATNDPGLFSPISTTPPGPGNYVVPLPLVGWLKGAGPNALHPCTPGTDANNNPLPLFLSNQISSFTDPAKSPASGTAKGSSGGTGSCWVLTYLTPGETPTVTVTQPVNGFTYQQNQTNAATQANYTCTTVNNSNVSVGGQPIGAVGPYLTLALTNGCTATDSVGGSVAQGAQFDTATLGPHTFTATVVDSALNTVSSTPVTYNVVAATNVAIQNSASNQTTPGSKLTYVITAWDSGPANAVNTLVTDTLAPGTTFVSASGVNIGLPCTTVGGKTSCKLSYTPITCMGSALSSVVTCPVGTIMPISLFDLNGAVIEVTVLVNQQGTKQNPTKLSNTATVTQSNAETKQDNSSTAITTVN
jgi:uncharacterized repeat protein (TIGR01451 family)